MFGEPQSMAADLVEVLRTHQRFSQGVRARPVDPDGRGVQNTEFHE